MGSPADPTLRDRAVRQALERAGIQCEWRVCAAPTRTAAQAAAALGVEVDAIVKSLLFIAGDSPVLVLVAGHHRADVARLSAALGRPVRRARAGEVVRVTGFLPGEVPPCGHPQHLPTLCDAALLTRERVWAAGGTPTAMFGIRPDDLVRVAGAQVLPLADDAMRPD